MSISTPKDMVPKFFDDTAESYDAVAHWATFGKDGYWKKKIITQMNNPNSILDLACGTGILTRKIASQFPKSDVTGIDITKSYLDAAKKKSASFRNISYFLQDAEEINLDQKFDCICSSYIPKYCNPQVLIKNCISYLNPGGMIILHDFTYPKNAFIQKLWNIHFILLNFAGIFIPEWKKAFLELPKLIRSSTWVTSYQEDLEQNGFEVRRINLTLCSSSILVAILGEKHG